MAPTSRAVGPAPACAGCLGSTQCWICTGEGCVRCAASGRCHLCVPQVDLARLIPSQPATPAETVASS